MYNERVDMEIMTIVDWEGWDLCVKKMEWNEGHKKKKIIYKYIVCLAWSMAHRKKESELEWAKFASNSACLPPYFHTNSKFNIYFLKENNPHEFFSVEENINSSILDLAWSTMWPIETTRIGLHELIEGSISQKYV